jgi:hypothetical protein
MVWLMMAAVVSVLGMPGLRSSEGVKLQHAKGGGTLQMRIHAREDDEDTFADGELWPATAE